MLLERSEDSVPHPTAISPSPSGGSLEVHDVVAGRKGMAAEARLSSDCMFHVGRAASGPIMSAGSSPHDCNDKYFSSASMGGAGAADGGGGGSCGVIPGPAAAPAAVNGDDDGGGMGDAGIEG